MKVAIVTGASRGLGLATARALTQAGYFVAGCARTWGKEGAGSVAVKLDIRKWKHVLRWVKDVESWYGPVDVLVNNAGYLHDRKPVQEIAHADFDPCFETNWCAPLTFIQAVLPGMLRRNSGVIVNISSKAARSPPPGFAAYSASKAALNALTQTLAAELRGTNVRAYTVSPGGMSTAMREAAYGKEDAEKQQDPARVAYIITEIILARKYSMPDYPDLSAIPSGSDILIWKGEVTVFEMPDLR